ncbi:tetratricopeptide repeat protein [Ruicaihuangia caeni]|uniref:Tetratricopeptide repeat protein n=1 Tax=Ruicaihuangia caeni TaxID=3042517 RepID=A0AAW6T620_9MICO|nr:tetratricopeptide repeat protein [Klugiella sp. YN-L-19]MDI2098521.1 tetratricopeptide repeat protein [Klugiella sp. YN-L-19]
MSIVLGYDPVTLREKVDLQALGARLEEIGELRSTSALNEKVGLLRLAGQLDEALDVANAAVRLARFGGDREELVLARVRRAQVQQYQGKYETALVELTDCANEANAHDWPAAEAFALQHRGKVWFDQREYEKALRDFREALTIRVRIKASANQIDSSMVAVAVAESFVAPELVQHGRADAAGAGTAAPDLEHVAPAHAGSLAPVDMSAAASALHEGDVAASIDAVEGVRPRGTDALVPRTGAASASAGIGAGGGLGGGVGGGLWSAASAPSSGEPAAVIDAPAVDPASTDTPLFDLRDADGQRLDQGGASERGAQ